MEEIIPIEELDKIKKIKGEIRGAILKADIDFVLQEAGGGRVIDQIKDFEIHPILCTYLLGILARFHEIARKVKKVDVQEIKCPFKGDEYHEFLMRW